MKDIYLINAIYNVFVFYVYGIQTIKLLIYIK